MALAQRTAAAVTAVVVAAGTALFAAPAATAAGNGDWSAVPKRPNNAGPQFTPRQYFFFDLAPGSTVRDTVTLENSTRSPLRLTIYPADAFNVRAGGGFAVTPRDEESTDLGTWVNVEKTSVTVPPAKRNKETRRFVDGKVQVPFELTVPRNATPGDHAGAIVTIEPEPSTSVDQPSGANIGVQRALSVRIYARISGPLNPQLLITDVRYQRLNPAVMPFLGDQGGATIEYTYVNNGNVRITPQTTITYKGFLDRTLHSNGPSPRPEILPGQTITLTDTVQGMPVLDQVTARVEMKGDETADRALADLTAAADTVKWSVSWIFVIVSIVAIVALIVWRRVKSKRTDTTPRGKRARTPVSESAPA